MSKIILTNSQLSLLFSQLEQQLQPLTGQRLKLLKTLQKIVLANVKIEDSPLELELNEKVAHRNALLLKLAEMRREYPKEVAERMALKYENLVQETRESAQFDDSEEEKENTQEDNQKNIQEINQNNTQELNQENTQETNQNDTQDKDGSISLDSSLSDTNEKHREIISKVVEVNDKIPEMIEKFKKAINIVEDANQNDKMEAIDTALLHFYKSRPNM